MKKVLVTGATGFIGNYVVKELLARGYQVIATSVSQVKAANSEWINEVSYIPFDLRNLSADRNYFDFFGQPEMLIHLAWEGLPNYKDKFHIEDNLPRHYDFLKNLVQHGLQNVTVAGTCFEYGMQEGCLSEDMPSLPSNAYGIAKNELRILLSELSKEYPFLLKWPRLFYIYGKGQSPYSLLSQLQMALDRGDTVFNMSPGDQLRDYLAVEMVAEYLVKIAGHPKQTGIVNCCSGVPVSVKDMVTRYLEMKGSSIILNTGYYPYSDNEPRNFWGDTVKLKSILNNL